MRVAAVPSLEQPAERERGRLARTQLTDQPRSGANLRGVVRDRLGPAAARLL